MENTLDDKTNKEQALIKLQIAKDNLEGVDEALSFHNRPRIQRALALITEVLSDLDSERNLRK